MVEECVITFGFNKENPRNVLTLSIQQPRGQPNKATFQKGKGTKQEYVVPHHILLKGRKQMLEVRWATS